jgi:hypothetical protein
MNTDIDLEELSLQAIGVHLSQKHGLLYQAPEPSVRKSIEILVPALKAVDELRSFHQEKSSLLLLIDGDALAKAEAHFAAEANLAVLAQVVSLRHKKAVVSTTLFVRESSNLGDRPQHNITIEKIRNAPSRKPALASCLIEKALTVGRFCSQVVIIGSVADYSALLECLAYLGTETILITPHKGDRSSMSGVVDIANLPEIFMPESLRKPMSSRRFGEA